MRVAITTDRPLRALAAARRLGLEPIHLPCIEVVTRPAVELARARAAAAAADLLLVTSARTVELLWPDGGMPSVSAAVVGARTAAAVTAAGGRVVAVRGPHTDGRPLRVTGKVVAVGTARPHPAGTARLVGGDTPVEHVAVYDVRPVAPGRDPVAAVTFASPSAVAGWHRSRDLEGLVVAVVGPSTAAAVERHGGRVHVVAPRPDLVSTIEALATEGSPT